MLRPKVSVIIPMYNCERYIKKCLDSLLEQSVSEYEVIIVNDGSTDGSEKLVSDYICTHRASYFRLISKTNGGISSARNVGIENANGKWLTFVDADDWVESDYLKSMLEPVEKEPADFCIAGYRKYFEDSGEMKDCYAPQNCSCMREKAINKIYFPAPFARMYSRSIVMDNGLRFDERLRVGEDQAFNFNYLCYVKRCLLINVRYYIYRIHSNSITKKSTSPLVRKHSFEPVKRFWQSFSDTSIVKNAFLESRYLSQSMFDSLLWDVICEILEGNRGVDILNDPIASYIVDHYKSNNVTKEKLFTFLLKKRLSFLLEIIVKVYYDTRLHTLLKKFYHAH